MSKEVVIAVPDLISPSYFPAVAAVQLGYLEEQGVESRVELLYPVPQTAQALKDRKIDFFAGAAHAPAYAFPQWKGAKLLTALSQNTYWFLVMRTDLGIERGDLGAIKNARIGAAPGVDLALRRLFADAGVDLESQGIEIGPVSGASTAELSFGLAAADALANGAIDGFWANGMGTEVAVRQGTGNIVIDARRDHDVAPLRDYTFPALATTDELIAQNPELVTKVVRAVHKAQRELAKDPSLATQAASQVFPEVETSLIAELVARDAPYYQHEISEYKVEKLVAFSQSLSLVGAGGGLDRRDLVFDI